MWRKSECGSEAFREELGVEIKQQDHGSCASTLVEVLVDAEVAVPNVVRQLDSSVETDEQDSEMSSLTYGKAQLIPVVVDERVNKQVNMDDGELQSMSHKLMK